MTFMPTPCLLSQTFTPTHNADLSALATTYFDRSSPLLSAIRIHIRLFCTCQDRILYTESCIRANAFRQHHPRTSSNFSSSSGADSHTPFPSSKSANFSHNSQEPQETVSSTAKPDDQPEHRNHIEIEATDGFRSGNLDTTPTEISSLHIPTFDRLYKPQVLAQDGLE
ncbi:hypothetical protein BDZ45DRAFT_745600 [Acephala macrosclerotiorum]|nr:hypothetical protein BDZ45DRAFT_745600 [Acephala macrosclerotiorum]